MAGRVTLRLMGSESAPSAKNTSKWPPQRCKKSDPCTFGTLQGANMHKQTKKHNHQRSVRPPPAGGAGRNPFGAPLALKALGGPVPRHKVPLEAQEVLEAFAARLAVAEVVVGPPARDSKSGGEKGGGREGRGGGQGGEEEGRREGK